MEAANLPAFQYLETQKNHRYICVVLQKWRLISHILASVWLLETTLSSATFFLGTAGWQGQGEGKVAAPLASPFWHRQCCIAE